METPLFSIDRRFADFVFEQQSLVQPELTHYTSVWRQKCVRDILLHLQFLDQSIAAQSTDLFRDYMVWVNTVLQQRGMKDSGLDVFLTVLQDVFQDRLVNDAYTILIPYLLAAKRGISDEVVVSDISAFQPDKPFYKEAKAYFDILMEKDRQMGLRKVQEFIQQGISIKDIYLHIFQPVQYEFGRLWQMNRISVAQEHFATALTQLAMSQLYPQVFNNERAGFRMIAACVGSEFHEVGIRMVTDFFEMAGWDTYYLGANMPAEEIIKAIKDYDADLLALSITMTTQIINLRNLITNIREGVHRDIKVLVGGHPFNVDPKAWQVIGADGYAADAEDAVNTAFTLVT